MIIMLILILGVAVICDVYCYKVPNSVTIAGMMATLLIGLSRWGPSGLLTVAISQIVIFTILYPVYLCNGLGAGDVKLFMVIAGISGIRMTFELLILSLIIAMIFGFIKKIILIIRCNEETSIIKRILTGKTKIRFTPAIMMAFILVVYIGR